MKSVLRGPHIHCTPFGALRGVQALPTPDRSLTVQVEFKVLATPAWVRNLTWKCFLSSILGHLLHPSCLMSYFDSAMSGEEPMLYIRGPGVPTKDVGKRLPPTNHKLPSTSPQLISIKESSKEVMTCEAVLIPGGYR